MLRTVVQDAAATARQTLPSGPLALAKRYMMAVADGARGKEYDEALWAVDRFLVENHGNPYFAMVAVKSAFSNAGRPTWLDMFHVMYNVGYAWPAGVERDRFVADTLRYFNQEMNTWSKRRAKRGK